MTAPPVIYTDVTKMQTADFTNAFRIFSSSFSICHSEGIRAGILYQQPQTGC